MTEVRKLFPPKIQKTWLLRFNTSPEHPDQWLTVQAYDKDDAFAQGEWIERSSNLTFTYDMQELQRNTIDTQP